MANSFSVFLSVIMNIIHEIIAARTSAVNCAHTSPYIPKTRSRINIIGKLSIAQRIMPRNSAVPPRPNA